MIERYEILIYSVALDTWVEDLTYCDGTANSVLQNRLCLFPMQDLRDTYGYVFRDLVTFKIRSMNAYGWSLAHSPENAIGATIRVEPVAVGTIFINAFETTTQQVTVYWSELESGEDRGDGLILSYNLQWDSGTNAAEWTNLIGNPVESLLV